MEKAPNRKNYREILVLAECNWVQNREMLSEQYKIRLDELHADFAKRGQLGSPGYLIACGKVRIDELVQLTRRLVDDCIRAFKETDEEWNDVVEKEIEKFAVQKFKEEQHELYQFLLNQAQRRGISGQDIASAVLRESSRVYTYITPELRKQKARSKLGIFKKESNMLDYEIKIIERMSQHIGKGYPTSELFPDDEFPDRGRLQAILQKYSGDKNVAQIHMTGLPPEVDLVLPRHGSLVLLDELVKKKQAEKRPSTAAIQIGNVHAPLSIVIGDFNQSIAIMEEKGIAELPQLMNEIKTLIDSSVLGEEEKVEVLENLQTIADQTTKSKPNKGVLLASLEKALELGGRISSVLPLLEKLGKMLGL